MLKGIRQTDGSVLATRVEIEKGPGQANVELEGPVSGRSGDCPNLALTVRGTAVVTNSVTRFEGGPCSRVQNGSKVEVKGTRQTDGKALATKLEIDD